MAVLSIPQEMEIPAEEVQRELERVLSDRRFATTQRSVRFLRYVVERWLEGKADEIKEVVIADDLYGRLADYDPKIDSAVRVEATRLRARLRSYYENEGKWNRIRITIPKGSYVPRFEKRSEQALAMAEMTPHGGWPACCNLRLASM